MHMSDALISPIVAGAAYAVSGSLIALSIARLKHTASQGFIPLTGVMGSFVLVAQMVNFAIPGTGSSGHIIGGVLLAALLGPWAAYLTLCCVLLVQCLFFADGGLMALGCNVLNMAAMSCLVAWPLVYRPLSQRMASRGGQMAASVLACSLAAVLGALALVAEVAASGIASLPPRIFASFMLPIHLVIGIIEGVVTYAVVSMVRRHRPSLAVSGGAGGQSRRSGVVVAMAVVTMLTLVVALLFASSAPDGMEWSVQNTEQIYEQQR